jgi:hypothetical protein
MDFGIIYVMLILRAMMQKARVMESWRLSHRFQRKAWDLLWQAMCGRVRIPAGSP